VFPVIITSNELRPQRWKHGLVEAQFWYMGMWLDTSASFVYTFSRTAEERIKVPVWAFQSILAIILGMMLLILRSSLRFGF
jgi:hypothetical protein